MVKMFHTCLDDTLQHLSDVEKVPLLYYGVYRFRNLRIIQAKLRSFRMFIWCIPDCDANLLAGFDFLSTSIAQLYKLEPGTDSFALTFTDYYSLLIKVYEELNKCDAQVSEDRYRHHLISSFSCQAGSEPSCFTSDNETTEFLDSVHVVLNDLRKYMNKSIDPNLDSQIEPLVELLFLLRDMVYYTNPQTDLIFRFIVRDWANKAACLSLLLGPVGIDKGTRTSLFIDLQQIVSPCYPVFIKHCFEVIKVPNMKREDRLLFGEFVSRFVDFFLDNLMSDDFPMVREGFIFLITFLADPPSNIVNHSELIPFVREQVYSVLDQASDNICFFSETNMELDFSRGKTILDDFLKSIDEVREDIVNLYVHIPPLSWSNSPRINGHGYFECLFSYLENLKETMSNNSKLVPFLKHQVFTIHQELLPLKLFLLNTWTMQNEGNELKDIWEQLMNLYYHTDFAIKSSFFVDDPIWYNLTCLSFLIRKIKDNVSKIDFESQTKGSHVGKPLMSSTDVPKPPTSTSIVESVVGFEKETKLLIDRLERGSKHLDIVSIVGMGGIGKTTLAKKLYNEPSIQHHFHKRAFCTVSQGYKKRNVLLDILKHISLNDDEIPQMSDDELANRLRQSLLGFRYLVVVDDIWDINVWYDLRASFPDNYNGSRVIFTTRINTISESTPCLVPFLSDVESWELLQQKIFHKDPCPEHLLNAGKLIAKNCKGLPLAIVVIAGLLARKERNLLQWNDVGHTLSSFASSEGCSDIIRLSYEHLPEALRSCFLYIGAFPKGHILKAKRLTSFWIAEGFVFKSGSRCSHKIAKKYLNDLGDRNLVTVTERSCNDGIKSCLVHDLIHDFCRAEAKEKHYMCYINAHNKNIPISSVLHEYRISIEAEWRSFVDAKPRGLGVHSLLYFPESFVSYPEDVCELNSLQSFLCKFKLVEVLDLSGIIVDGEFPMTITTLVHLRSLSLRFSVALNVPPDIINLWNLETLILCASEYSREYYSVNGDWTENSNSGSPALEPFLSVNTLYEVALPNDIWKMKRLKRVELTALSKIALDDVTGVFSLLPDLITFGFLFMHPTEDGDELLRRLSNVRKFSCLCIGWWDPDRECNRLPKLEILTKVESLIMTHVGEPQPPYMFSFPTTLRKLTLVEFGVPWNEFSAIMGMLPCLEVLVLQKNSFGGKRWIVEEDEQFPTIKSLTLHNLDIEEWNASIDSFPSLEKLVVVMCIQLIAIPSCFSEALTLKSINVHACKKSAVDSAIEIQNDQIDSGNESFKLNLFGNYT